MSATISTPVPPELRALLLQLRAEIMLDISCALPGTIQSFNTAIQSASVSINLKRLFRGQPLDYPVLVDVPVVCLGGGGARLTFPIEAGDGCLVLFSDRDIDAWWATGSTGSIPNSPRTHNLSDGFAIVGLRSKVGALSNYSSDAELAYNGGFVDVNSKIGIGNASTTLKAALDSLMSALLNWVDTNGDTPNASTISALNSAKSLFDSLLK
jgi:hypothetical protein